MNDKTTTEGAKIIFVTSQYGLQQITNEPTHILENSWSCIDLIFTSHPNLIVNAKFNLKIHSPPPYEQKMVLRAREHWTY